MDVNLNSMNNIYYKTTNGVGKMSAKFITAEPQNTISASQQKQEKSDQVSISSAATQQYEIHKMTKSVMKDMDAVDTNEKVERIKTQIENNTYQISPDKIADAILSRWTL